MTIKEAKDAFAAAFGGTLRLKGDDSALLSSVGCKGEISFDGTTTVGDFCTKCAANGLKAKVGTCDNWVAALDGFTLDQIQKIPKSTTKVKMEALLASLASETTTSESSASPAPQVKSAEPLKPKETPAPQPKQEPKPAAATATEATPAPKQEAAPAKTEAKAKTVQAPKKANAKAICPLPDLDNAVTLPPATEPARPARACAKAPAPSITEKTVCADPSASIYRLEDDFKTQFGAKLSLYKGENSVRYNNLINYGNETLRIGGSWTVRQCIEEIKRAYDLDAIITPANFELPIYDGCILAELNSLSKTDDRLWFTVYPENAYNTEDGFKKHFGSKLQLYKSADSVRYKNLASFGQKLIVFNRSWSVRQFIEEIKCAYDLNAIITPANFDLPIYDGCELAELDSLNRTDGRLWFTVYPDNAYNTEDGFKKHFGSKLQLYKYADAARYKVLVSFGQKLIVFKTETPVLQLYKEIKETYGLTACIVPESFNLPIVAGCTIGELNTVRRDDSKLCFTIFLNSIYNTEDGFKKHFGVALDLYKGNNHVRYEDFGKHLKTDREVYFKGSTTIAEFVDCVEAASDLFAAIIPEGCKLAIVSDDKISEARNIRKTNLYGALEIVFKPYSTPNFNSIDASYRDTLQKMYQAKKNIEDLFGIKINPVGYDTACKSPKADSTLFSMTEDWTISDIVATLANDFGLRVTVSDEKWLNIVPTELPVGIIKNLHVAGENIKSLYKCSINVEEYKPEECDTKAQGKFFSFNDSWTIDQLKETLEKAFGLICEINFTWLSKAPSNLTFASLKELHNIWDLYYNATHTVPRLSGSEDRKGINGHMQFSAKQKVGDFRKAISTNFGINVHCPSPYYSGASMPANISIEEIPSYYIKHPEVEFTIDDTTQEYELRLAICGVFGRYIETYDGRERAISSKRLTAMGAKKGTLKCDGSWTVQRLLTELKDKGSSRNAGAYISRKVLNLRNENRRCYMDVLARWTGRAV